MTARNLGLDPIRHFFMRVGLSDFGLQRCAYCGYFAALHL
jgi:hypothetical protein